MSTKRDKRAGHINGSADRTGQDDILGERQIESSSYSSSNASACAGSTPEGGFVGADEGGVGA